MMTPERILCPRCGESLPATLDRCDACGASLDARAYVGATAAAGSPSAPVGSQSKQRHPGGPASGERSHGRVIPKQAGRKQREGVPGVGWLLLVVGLAVGGLIGFVLHSSIGPRVDGGMPTGPSDLMGGSPSGGMGGAGAGGSQPMPAEIMNMVRSYRETLEKNPNDLEANIGLANLMFDSGQWDKAVEHYSRALSIDAKNPDVRVDRGIAYHNLGQDKLAIADFTRVTKENPTHKNAWLNLGVVSRHSGDRATAIRAWERYLELEPSGERSNDIRQELNTLKQSG